MAVEFWTMGAGVPTRTAPGSDFIARSIDGVQMAVEAEQMGYDGIVWVDSQNLAPDCYISMALAAHATSRIQLGTGVTNSYTRHAAITASCIATVQAESQGRAHMGIGRGDSALAHLGLAPHAVDPFERYLKELQAYLRGDSVEFGDSDVDALGLADTPEASSIRYINSMGPKVPLDVAATGPRVIQAAARHADRISFNVGADVDRTLWGMEVAREARAEAGLDAEIPFAAYIPLAVHDDPERAMQIGAGQVSLFARFSNMYGQIVGPATEQQAKVLTDIHDNYDMHGHGRPGSAQADVIPTEFERSFGVFGPPDYCVQRLGELIEIGIDRFIFRGSPLDPNDPDTESSVRFTQEVIPQLKG